MSYGLSMFRLLGSDIEGCSEVLSGHGSVGMVTGDNCYMITAIMCHRRLEQVVNIS